MKEIHLMERVTGHSSGSHFPSFLRCFLYSSLSPSLPPFLPLSSVPSWLPSFPPWLPPLFPPSHPPSFSSFIICFGVIERPCGLRWWLRGKESACNAGDAGLIPESTCNAGDLGLIPGLGKSPGKAKGYPLQYSGLENSMDCIVHGVAKSQTRLRDFHFTSLGISPGGGHDNPFWYSCLESPMDRGASWATYSPWSHEELDVTEHAHTLSIIMFLRQRLLFSFKGCSL